MSTSDVAPRGIPDRADMAGGPLETLDFLLPPSLAASEPPEARGLARDEVRLMVSYRQGDRVTHATFRELPSFLDPGDLLVINTSGTLNAALPAAREDGTPLALHLSTHLPADLWIVEPRETVGAPKGTTTRLRSAIRAGETVTLPGGAAATLHVPYRHDPAALAVTGDAPQDPPQDPPHARPPRLWIATLRLPCPLLDYLAAQGRPIRYDYVKQDWPPATYQTVYATELGSAEMPSAGRAFTPEALAGLVARGVVVAPLLLHTGVASPEDGEPPYEEFYRVPLSTARLVNLTHRSGRRVVAVGTTVVRALETATDADGATHPGEGWTRLVVTPGRGLRAIDALLTGLHEPRSSHLAMLEALAGRAHLRTTYAAALQEGYLWHEFGDLHLIMGR